MVKKKNIEFFFFNGFQPIAPRIPTPQGQPHLGPASNQYQVETKQSRGRDSLPSDVQGSDEDEGRDRRIPHGDYEDPKYARTNPGSTRQRVGLLVVGRQPHMPGCAGAFLPNRTSMGKGLKCGDRRYRRRLQAPDSRGTSYLNSNYFLMWYVKC